MSRIQDGIYYIYLCTIGNTFNSVYFLYFGKFMFFWKNFFPIIWWYHCKTTFLNEIYTLTFFQFCTFLIYGIHFSFHFPKQNTFWTIWDALKSNFQPAYHNNLWLYYYNSRNYGIYTFHERSFALKVNYVKSLSIHYTLNGKTNTFKIKIIFRKISKII